MIRTRVTEILGVELPILLGGMAWITGWEMAAAVSEAGGLGTIAAGTLESQELLSHIGRLREKTANPFAVNIPIRLPTSREAVDVSVAEQVPVIVLSAGDPAKYAERIRGKGIKVFQVVFNLEMVKRCNEVGVDGIIAMGTEAGGNLSPSELSTFVLVREVVESTDLPVVAAGGIADAKGFVAALALGAEGVQMGTRFLATREATLHVQYKEAVVRAKDTDTVVTGRSTGLQFRVLRNALAERILIMEREGKGKEEIDAMTIGSLKRAVMEGDLDQGSFMMGQVAGMIHEIKTIREVMEDLITGSTEEMNRIGRYFQ